MMNWQRLSHASRDTIRVVQNRAFVRFVHHQLLYSPYYRELFKKNDLAPSDFRSTDDLVKLPFTTKEDIAPTDEDRARPRQFILQPDEHLLKRFAPKTLLMTILAKKLLKHDVKRELAYQYKPVHLHFTTGRTALPTFFGYSRRDLETLKETGNRLFNVSGLQRDDVAVNAFPYSPHLAFWLAYYAMVDIGMLGLPSGGGKIMGTQKIIDALERMKATCATFIPGYCYHVLREAVRQKRDFSSLKAVIFGGERVSPGLRDRVQELLKELGASDVRILATYAMTEAKTGWIQCSEGSGYHLYPDLEFFEVVDEEGRRVKDGEKGQLVYTALDWRGSIVVRYKTGDVTNGIAWGVCPSCCRTVPRIDPDIQRSSDIREFNLTKVKGELVNLNNFYPLLSSVPELEEWQVTLRKKHNDPFEVDEVVVTVAPKDGTDFDVLRPKLERAVEEAVNIGVEIVEAPLPDLLRTLGMETELKEKRIVDERPK